MDENGAVELWIQEQLEAAPPLTSTQLDTIRRCLSRNEPTGAGPKAA